MKDKNIRGTVAIAKDYLYILPAVVLVGIFFIGSIIFTLHLSFFSWDGFSEKIFVGIENYSKIFADQNFWVSVTNTLIWSFVSLMISLMLPLVLALMIVGSSLPSVFKNIFYFPATLSSTVGGLLMVAMLSTYGLPQIFGLFGMNFMVRDWLAVPKVNTFVMIFMGTWQGIGMNLLLFIAGIINIDKTPIEAAQIDGVSKFALYRHVILPELQPTTIVVFLMSLVNSLKVFDIIWIMTKGGPYRSSETLALTMYTETFVRNNYGAGSAIAVILTIIIMFVAYFNLRNTFKENQY